MHHCSICYSRGSKAQKKRTFWGHWSHMTRCHSWCVGVCWPSPSVLQLREATSHLPLHQFNGSGYNGNWGRGEGQLYICQSRKCLISVTTLNVSNCPQNDEWQRSVQTEDKSNPHKLRWNATEAGTISRVGGATFGGPSVQDQTCNLQWWRKEKFLDTLCTSDGLKRAKNQLQGSKSS